MKIAYITPGSGDNFYCQNCFRDDELLTSLLVLGQDVRKIPMYLPSGYNESAVPGAPVFYGADRPPEFNTSIAVDGVLIPMQNGERQLFTPAPVHELVAIFLREQGVRLEGITTTEQE